jgi:hypothetical protein
VAQRVDSDRRTVLIVVEPVGANSDSWRSMATVGGVTVSNVFGAFDRATAIEEALCALEAAGVELEAEV